MPSLEKRTTKNRSAQSSSGRDAGILAGFNSTKAAEALADGLKYLRDQWNWNGSKIARVLHLSPTTINGWLRKGSIPVSERNISPEVEAVIHLLAVHRNLAAMFTESFHQLQWLTTEHPDFGTTPFSKMSESMASLIQIRQYLDYVRGRGA